MPAHRSSSLSPFSSSSDTSKQLALTGSPNISFLDNIKLFNDNDSFSALQVALFERQDLIVKTSEMKHLAPLVKRLQDEANRQQEHIEEIFNGMEAAGLHRLLKKTLRTQQRSHSNTMRGRVQSTTIIQKEIFALPSTFYPGSTIITFQICFILFRFITNW